MADRDPGARRAETGGSNKRAGTRRTGKKQAGKKKRAASGVGIALLALAALGLVFYFMGGVGVHRGSRRAQPAIRENVAALRELEQQPPVDLKQEARYFRLTYVIGSPNHI